MKLYMKQKVFSLRQNFDIYDENQVSIFKVESKLISLGRQSTIYDSQTQKELAFVKQKLMALSTTVDVFINDQQVTRIKQRFLTLFKPKFDIQNLGWTIEGDFWGYNYTIRDHEGDVVATIRKKILSWSDTYEFDINENEADLILVMAVIIAVDIAKDAAERN